MASDRRSYDLGASSEAQGNIQAVVSRLEAVINQRDAAVKAAMADFQADGVSEAYHGKEQQWNKASNEVRQIISLVKSTLEKHDTTAQGALSRAKNAIDGIA